MSREGLAQGLGFEEQMPEKRAYAKTAGWLENYEQAARTATEQGKNRTGAFPSRKGLSLKHPEELLLEAILR